MRSKKCPGWQAGAEGSLQGDVSRAKYRPEHTENKAISADWETTTTRYHWVPLPDEAAYHGLAVWPGGDGWLVADTASDKKLRWVRAPGPETIERWEQYWIHVAADGSEERFAAYPGPSVLVLRVEAYFACGLWHERTSTLDREGYPNRPPGKGWALVKAPCEPRERSEWIRAGVRPVEGDGHAA